jgi:hypothetical protein
MRREGFVDKHGHILPHEEGYTKLIYTKAGRYDD